MAAVTPIFLFSVSRSGSTLVQRIIAAHEGVATVSEPWILLPLVYPMRREGVLAEYVHPLMVDAIADFCEELPGGAAEYRREVHDFAMRLYSQVADADAQYFLDKSPPYCLVSEDIMQLFPEGKFIFLWRNPLSIIGSIIETWQNGRWHPAMFRSDLFIGLPRLVEAYSGNAANSYAARYEDLVLGEDAHWRPLMRYLGMEFNPETITEFSSIGLRGRMGDPTGTKQYKSLVKDTSEKWRYALNNPIRRAWCRRYLQFLGAERLKIMGYSLEELIADLDTQRGGTTALFSDAVSVMVDLAKEPFRLNLQRSGLGGQNVMRALLRR